MPRNEVESYPPDPTLERVVTYDDEGTVANVQYRRAQQPAGPIIHSGKGRTLLALLAVIGIAVIGLTGFVFFELP